MNTKRVGTETETDSSVSHTGSDVKQKMEEDDYQTMTWLECTAVPPGNKLVDKLKCKVCTNYMDRLEILDCFFIKIHLKIMSEQNAHD